MCQTVVRIQEVEEHCRLTMRQNQRRESVTYRADARHAPAFWSAAGSEAPRRFGFCARGEHETSLPIAFRKRRRLMMGPSRCSGLTQAQGMLSNSQDPHSDGPRQLN